MRSLQEARVGLPSAGAFEFASRTKLARQKPIIEELIRANCSGTCNGRASPLQQSALHIIIVIIESLRRMHTRPTRVSESSYPQRTIRMRLLLRSFRTPSADLNTPRDCTAARKLSSAQHTLR